MKLPHLLLAAATLVTASSAFAATGTWSTDANGNWSTGPWTGGVPDATDDIADFSTLDITGNRTVTVDTSRTIGTLKFGDTGATGDSAWTLASSGGATLTLATGSGQPTIDLGTKGGGADGTGFVGHTISATLAGTNGFNITGNNQVLFKPGALDGISGTATISGGRMALETAGLGGLTAVDVKSGGQIGLWVGGTYAQNFSIAGTGYGEAGYEVALRGANSGTLTLTGGVTLTGNAAVGGRGDGVTKFNGVISESGGSHRLTIGTGTLNGIVELNAANDYTGGTTIRAGKVRVGNTSAFGTGAISVTGNATIENINGFTNNISIAASTTLTIGREGGWNAVSGTISGDGNLTLNNSVRITGNNTFKGNVTVTGGYVTITKDAAFGDASNTITYTGGSISTYGAGAAVNLSRNITLSGNIGIDTNGYNLTLSGILSGTGGLVKNSGGNLATLAGINTYTGKTTVSGGNLTIASTGAINVTQAGGVTLSGAGNLVVDGTLNLTSGAATLLNSGTGTLTLGETSVLNLGSIFNGQADGSTYQLISGTTSGTFGTILFDTNAFSSVTFDNTNGLLTFTAVPEPSTYGLIGAGALAAVAFVRRRRKTAGGVA